MNGGKCFPLWITCFFLVYSQLSLARVWWTNVHPDTFLIWQRFSPNIRGFIPDGYVKYTMNMWNIQSGGSGWRVGDFYAWHCGDLSCPLLLSIEPICSSLSSASPRFISEWAGKEFAAQLSLFSPAVRWEKIMDFKTAHVSENQRQHLGSWQPTVPLWCPEHRFQSWHTECFLPGEVGDTSLRGTIRSDERCWNGSVRSLCVWSESCRHAPPASWLDRKLWATVHLSCAI